MVHYARRMRRFRDFGRFGVNTVRGILAVYLAVTAVAVALLLAFTPLIHDGSPEYPIWGVLNWFMAPGAVAVLVVSVMRDRSVARRGDAPDMIERVSVSAALYGSIALFMLFFWEWLWSLNPESETGNAVISHMIYFPIMDVLYVAVCVATARYLWRRAVSGS